MSHRKSRRQSQLRSAGSGSFHAGRRSHKRRPQKLAAETGRPLRLESLEERSLLAVFSVTNLDNAGTGSLRQAMIEANAAGTDDEIVFAAGVTGAINLTSALPSINDSLTIIGPGAEQLTINAGGGDFVFSISKISSTR